MALSNLTDASRFPRQPFGIVPIRLSSISGAWPLFLMGFPFLPERRTPTSGKRPQYEQRHEKVIPHHDNARSHVAKPGTTYLETLKWEVLPHSPHSQDIAPFDYHLFRSMAHGLAEDIERWPDSWIASTEHFYYNGIRAVAETKVVASDGRYFERFEFP
ncbi:hypothetical protein Trydic_g12512 [Trypoxylus dichotomus]